MVCIEEENSYRVTLQDDEQLHEPIYITLTPLKTIDDIFKEISDKFEFHPEEVEIIFKANGKDIQNLSGLKDKTLNEAGLWPVAGINDYELVVTRPKKNMSLSVCDAPEDDLRTSDDLGASDDLLLGASASPTTQMDSWYPEYNFKYQSCNQKEGHTRRKALTSSIIAESPNYVGLVNQAMTCYLNSLLQALFMTPEFRNALYNWKFDGGSETRSIPFQLQKLFLNLQTSTKSAVETTDLTTSFGWQGSDAWHQHDIQELCRVMFDALEQKFKSTNQANLINDLYEGKMLDYVKCLECHTEKSREDTFLDIPLPVRPFGSSVAYNSVEEALRAFVQPETLDGNNQYFCEKCNKKCDAHKGLKFIKFPYLLTLHLKRFDFDYNTMHRIKLNDKVVFPEKLNLNSFIPATKTESEPLEERETVVKCDDCSTTDSGSADDESCQGTDMSSTVNGQDDNCGDSDEGIDVSSGNNHHENEAKGPYVYELFSIMIHSGSASGGHYYAYIKDFDKNRWYCFNDQCVSPITEDDIKKTYGGGPQRGYYSGVYSSSTNAYMLMYRQIDKDRNCQAMTVNEFPPHIQALLHDMREKEEQDRLNRKKEDEMVKINIVYVHPITNLMMEIKISTFMDSTLSEVARHAYSRLKLDNLVDFKDCRLVMFNKKFNCIDCSFDNDELKLKEVVRKLDMMYTDWMLEVKEPGTSWNNYKRGGINVKVYPVNVDTEDIDEPKLVRVDVDETFGEFKKEVSEILNVDPTDLKVVSETYNGEPKHFKDDNETITLDYNLDYKFYVANLPDNAQVARLKKVAEKFEYIIGINVVLPDTDESTLEFMCIPSLDLNQNVDSDRETASPNLRVSPQPNGAGMCGDGYDQSNSEDSSLSDSDRTLIGDAPECVGVMSSSSPSPADQHMSSPSDPCQDTYNYDVMGRPGEEMNWDYSETVNHNYFFKVTSIVAYNNPDVEESKTLRCCKILADKRMSLETLKKHLELVLKVPSEYFKVYKQHPISEEWFNLKDTLRSIKDGDKLSLRLDRVLKEDEHNCKIYHLKLENPDSNRLLFEHIISKDQTVGAVKRDILLQAKKQNLLDIPVNKCRLREKNWKKPVKVYIDDQKFGTDISITFPFELFLQELAEPETVTSDNQVVVFTRRWNPSTLTLGPFQEVVLDMVTLTELKTKISAMSGIPKEFVDMSYIKQNFPCDMHILEINDDLDWNPNSANINHWLLNIEDGSVFFYKDSREEPKELTREERKEIKQKEDTRLGRFNIKTYSPGRERALKIYLDTSPSKSDDGID